MGILFQMIYKLHNLLNSVIKDLQVKSIKCKTFWDCNSEARRTLHVHKHIFFTMNHEVIDSDKNLLAIIQQIFNFSRIYSDYTKKKVAQYSICNNLQFILQNYKKKK